MAEVKRSRDPGAREVAFDVLLRVENGAWADELLRPRTLGMSANEAGLAWEIVFGVLRRRAQVDWHFIPHSGPIDRLDPEVIVALRIGAYQLLFLDRIPRHAAVSASVELVKRARKRSAAGMVNAVLRKLQAAPPSWPDEAIALSTPEWLLTRWREAFGAEAATAIAARFLERPESGPQDPGAAAIVPLLEVASGHDVLDLCAAPGNKTAQCIESGGNVVAVDLHAHRLRAVQGELRVAADATRPLPFVKTFPRILVDAPCSGTGTLGRNPEIKWRISPSDLMDLQQRQIAILTQALRHLAPQGRLVYSTCSLEHEENEAVIEAVAPGRVRASGYRLPGVEPGDGFFYAVLA